MMFARVIVVLSSLLVVARASGDFVVLNSPDSIIFKGDEEIDQSNLKEVFAAALGYSVKHQKTTWSGLSLSNPFDLPEAVVALAVEGVDSLGSIKGKRYPILVDEIEEATWQALRGRLEQRDSNNLLVRISLGDGLDALGQSTLGELKPETIEKIPLKELNLKNDEDKKFLEEIQLLHAIAKNVPTAVVPNGKPDVYWLVVSGLKAVFEMHGKNSAAAKEALELLNKAMSDVNNAFKDVYKNQVLITVFTNDQSQVHSRPKRQATDGEKTKSNKTKDDINLAKNPGDLPVIFNICLWFGAAFFFSLLAICITIAEMDPGRDSIIYRMTSNRMKKDN